ncbi:signal recognition particle-docking protein FtsY [Thiorhodovibrio winogradskyi]|nr:signal recognition particle-docking protein FtsY [Thiorhodovibrio winogradskyi]
MGRPSNVVLPVPPPAQAESTKHEALVATRAAPVTSTPEPNRQATAEPAGEPVGEPAGEKGKPEAKGGKKGGFFARLRGRGDEMSEHEPGPESESEPARSKVAGQRQAPVPPKAPEPKAPEPKASEQAVPAAPSATSKPERRTKLATGSGTEVATEPESKPEAESAATRASLLGAAKAEAEAAAAADQRRGMFARLKTGLNRTRAILNADIGDLVSGRKEIDEDLLEELETLLLTADVGVPATTRIIDDLSGRVRRHELSKPSALVEALRAELDAILSASAAPVRQPASGRPQVILMVGVNGVGKTTTIGKLAKQLQAEGNSIMLAAGDTFRAAAVEQLQTWGERNQVPVISQGKGADSASVIFDALQAATARGIDVLIADTAGRLHTKSNLMEELKKIARVMQKIDPDAPHEVMLVVDATTGQNALHQAQEFHRAIPLTGIALTKLDGTAKGGILFALADQLHIPIRFIGVGEQIDDLRYFEPNEFLDALLSP